MREEKLQQIKEMIPLMKSIVDEDLAVSVWNREGTVIFFEKADNFPLNFDIGYKMEDKSDKIFEAMNTGKRIHNVLPKEVFGVPIEGNLVPIFDEGKVVGCIVAVYYSEKKAELEKKSLEMQHILGESRDLICTVLNDSVSVTNQFKEINKYIANLEESINGIYSVIDSIKGNTSRTKMLALNAAIEAARAGESGKGFTIVASEMGKLSQMSAESVTHINNTLNSVVKSIDDVTNAIREIDSSELKNSELVENLLADINKISI